MASINKILLFFGIAVLLSWIGFLRFVESNYFSDLISQKVTSIVEDKIQSKIKFKKIDVHLFPMGTTLKDVEISSTSQDSLLDTNFKAKELTFLINVVDVWKKIFSIKKIILKDTRIDVDTNIKELDLLEKRLRDPSLLADIFKKSSKESLSYQIIKDAYSKVFPLNLKIIEGENIKLNLRNRSIDFKSIELNNFSNLIGARFVIQNYRGLDFVNEIQYIEAGVRLNPESLIVEKISIVDNLNDINIAGIVKNWSDSSKSSLDLVLKANWDFDFIPPSYMKNIIYENKKSGILSSNVEVKGSIKKPIVRFEGEIQKFQNSLVNVDKIGYEGSYIENELLVKNLSVLDKKGRVSLTSPISLFTKGKGLNFPIQINALADNFKFESGLWVLRKYLYPLRGNLFGNFGISINQEKTIFKSKEKMPVKNLELNFSNKEKRKKPILKIKESNLNKIEVSWKYKNTEVDIKGEVNFKGSSVFASGRIDNKGIKFSSIPRVINLEELGPISGLNLSGLADLGVELISDKKKQEMQFNGVIKDFKLLGFNLGNITSDFKLDLNKLTMVFDYMKGQYNQTSYTSFGDISFENEGQINLEFDFDQATYQDTLKMYEPIIKNLPSRPDEILGSYRTKYRLLGPFDEKKLVVIGDLSSERLDIAGESIEKLRTSLNYENEILSLDKFNFRKGDGFFSGDYIFIKKNQSHDFNINLNSLAISEFSFLKRMDLGFDGVMSGLLKGSGIYPDLEIIGSGVIKNSRVNNISVADSKVYFQNKNQIADIKVDLLGGIGKGSILLNYDKKRKSRSTFDYELKTKKMNLLMGIFSSNDSSNDVKGEIDVSGRVDFDIENLYNVNVQSEIKEFSLKRSDLDIKRVGRNIIEVKKGEIKKWNIDISGEMGKIRSTGAGNFQNDYKVQTAGFISSSIFEIFSKQLSYSRGKINFSSEASGKNKNKIFITKFDANDLDFNITPLSTNFENIKLNGYFDGKKIQVEKFDGFCGKGRFKSVGRIDFKIPFPSFNINIDVDKASLNLFDQSRFLISSNLKITGNKLPLDINGDAKILNGLLGEELEYFTSNVSQGKEGARYLPQVAGRNKLNFFKFNINLDVPSGIRVKNSLADFNLEGAGKLLGGESAPVLFGNFSLIPGSGKLLFNNKDFVLSKADINFSSQERNNPKFNIVGSSNITDYNVEIGINGEGSNYDIDLSSTPTLNREDILSLLTLGFTGEVSKNLEDQQRASLSSVGIGSLIFDKFQINKGLRSSLGLRVSVAPEISDSDESLLRGRSTSEGGGSTRVRTASKIQVQKKLNDELDLSVSSTVGGSIQQKQQMNLNYRLNRNFSVQGIYELKSYEDEQEDQDPSSVGLDLKFRMNFK